MLTVVDYEGKNKAALMLVDLWCAQIGHSRPNTSKR